MPIYLMSIRVLLSVVLCVTLKTYLKGAPFYNAWESRALCGISMRARKVGFWTFPARVFSTALPYAQFPMENRTAALVIATQAVGPIAEAQGPVQVLACNHGAARQRCSPAHGFDLQSQVRSEERRV